MLPKSINGKVRRESDARLIDQDSIEPGKRKKKCLDISWFSIETTFVLWLVCASNYITLKSTPGDERYTLEDFW